MLIDFFPAKPVKRFYEQPVCIVNEKIINIKLLVMKKRLHLEISKKETIAFIILMAWIAASFFIQLPELNSLGA